MSTNEKKLRFIASDKTVVLILTVTLPCNISERAERFYRDAATAFEQSVRDRLFYEAESAYEASTDRRKRYRYTPWQTEFKSDVNEDNIIELKITVNDIVLRHEKHFWSDDLLIKRLKLSP